MKLAFALVVLVAGCGGVAWEWDSRAVVGAEAQRVPLAGLENAAWLSIRGESGDVVYPLHAEGTDLVLDSPFVAGDLASRYDQYDETVVMRSGLLVVPLVGPYDRPPPDRYPGDRDLHGRFWIVVRDASGAPIASKMVDLHERIDPCGTTPITPLAETVAGLVVQILIQVACSESIG